jgi:hypothetical protein
MTEHRNTNNTPWNIQFAKAAVVALAGAMMTLGCAAPGEEAGDEEVGTAEDVGTAEEALTTNPKRLITSKLGLPNRMLVGLGNDVGASEGWDPNRAHAFTLGQKLDLHYLYLGGFEWWKWNSPDGAYITRNAQAAKSKGVIPMFTLYQAAAWGENNIGAFSNSDFMKSYWYGVRTMYKKLGELGSPSVVHIEPDLWGYFQQKGDSQSAVKVKVGSLVPECAGMPEDVSGFGRCLVKLGRQLAPKAIIGFQASTFAAYTNGVSDPVRIANYLKKVGADTDFVAVETLDRDAGCFEVGKDARCKRSGKFYWGDTEYRNHLKWAKTISTTTGKGLFWWQMPLGVPSGSSGYASHYRDNRVQWLFAHPKEFADAGGAAIVFGVGAPNQTTAKTDNNQFKNAATNYYRAPVWF